MDRNTRIFTDLNLNFSKHPATADVTKKVNEEAIKASVRNLILTRNYERPFHPEIGCQVHGLLFENYDPITREVMRRTIFEVIEKFEPRVTVTAVNIRDLPDENDLSIDIFFKINNSDRPLTLTTTITRAR